MSMITSDETLQELRERLESEEEEEEEVVKSLMPM
jgi:hypothetical protein